MKSFYCIVRIIRNIILTIHFIKRSLSIVTTKKKKKLNSFCIPFDRNFSRMKLISVSICEENSVNWKKWKASKSRISGKNSGSRCSRQAFENRSAKRATALDSSFVKRRAKQAIG